MLLSFALLLLGFLPFQFALPLGAESLPLIRLGALGLIVGVIIIWFTSPRRFFPPLSFMACFMGWFSCTTLSVLLSADPLLGLRKLFFLWNFFPLVFVWFGLSHSPRVAQRFTKAVIIGAVLCAGVALTLFAGQFLFGVERMFHWLTGMMLPFFVGEHLGALITTYPSLLVNIGGITWLRATAFFPDPHIAAYFFGLSACLSIGMWLEIRNRFFIFTSLILVLADLLTFSRGGYIGLLSAGIVFFWYTPQLRRHWIKWFGLGSIFTFCLFWFGMPVLDRFFSTFILADTSSTERLVLWQTAWETWLQHPWFGVGLGQYAEWIQPGMGANTLYYAHNLFLDIAVEVGGIGLIFFLALLWVAWYQAYQVQTGIAKGLLAAIALYLTHSFFETPLFSIHITLLLTLILALPFLLRHHPLPKTTVT